MNEHDLFDALSMIDPKYIEEAALELKTEKDDSSDSNVTDISRRTRKQRIRKALYIALPSVAAILLIVGVAIPAIIRITGSQSAAPASDAAMAPAPAAEAQDEPIAQAASGEAAETAGQSDAAATYEAPAEDFDREKTVGLRPVDNAPAVAQEAESAEYAEESEAAYDVIEEAVFENGKLTVKIPDLAPEDAKDTGYTISRFAENGKDIVLSEGTFEKAVYKDGAYTLDLSELDLINGTYYINTMDSTAEFTVH